MRSSWFKIWAFPITLVLYELAIYLANDAYLPALPDLQISFQASQDQIQDTLMVWFIGSATMQLFLGPISDRFGRRPVLIIACALFILASSACALTAHYGLFLVARFIQGVCVCSLAVAGYAAIHEQYNSKTAIQIIAIMSSITILAPAMGPLLGALIIMVFDWRWIFWLLTFMATLAGIGLVLYMPETRKQSAPIHVKRILLDYWKIATNLQSFIHTFTLGLALMGFVAWIVESAFIIQQTYGRSELEYGIIQLLVFGMIIFGANSARILIRVWTPKSLIHMGCFFMALAALCMLVMNQWIVESLYASVLFMMVMAFFSAIAFGALNRGAIDAATEPMGRRMAIFSTWTSIFASLATYAITLFNDKTLNNLSWVVCVPMVLSYLLWILGQQYSRKQSTSSKSHQ